MPTCSQGSQACAPVAADRDSPCVFAAAPRTCTRAHICLCAWDRARLQMPRALLQQGLSLVPRRATHASARLVTTGTHPVRVKMQGAHPVGTKRPHPGDSPAHLCCARAHACVRVCTCSLSGEIGPPSASRVLPAQVSRRRCGTRLQCRTRGPTCAAPGPEHHRQARQAMCLTPGAQQTRSRRCLRREYLAAVLERIGRACLHRTTQQSPCSKALTSKAHVNRCLQASRAGEEIPNPIWSRRLRRRSRRRRNRWPVPRR